MKKQVFSTTAISFIYSSPNALKHTRKYGKHEPFDSALLAKEVTDLFSEKINLREGDNISANFLTNKVKETIYIELNSQTSYIPWGEISFREIGANLNPNGTCTVVHLLDHKDEERFRKKNEQIMSNPFSYTVDVNDND